MKQSDLTACGHILCSVYNNELWQCRWTLETAAAYLTDFFRMEKFVGFVAEENGEILGAIFGHEKIWWNNSELYVDEMFVLPDKQRKGYGSMLISTAEEYIREKKLAGLTLCTNRYAPAPYFYRKNGFNDNEAIVFMYKESL